ncbi:MAG: SDR family oxidoreductase [Acidobacteriales bacterium]|nr:SDR family oxidoreductase [Terriglobales bacterium]
MQMQNNTILITGGGRGIGRGLAEAFHAEGNNVIIAGRGKKALEETVAANPGMKSTVVDFTDADAIVRFANQIKNDYPALNVVILNAGIMRTESVQTGDLADAEAIVATNLLGPIRLTAALLPILISKPHATIMTVSSGLAFVPLAATPTYCATKAAIHSYTQSLRYQLRQTQVEVLELIPPYVQTELLGPGQLTDPNAMPLKDFISETMRILKHYPGITEICVERVKPLRGAEASGNYDTVFKMFNDRAASAHTTL